MLFPLVNILFLRIGFEWERSQLSYGRSEFPPPPLSLCTDGQYKSRDSLLVFVPSYGPHGIVRIIKASCKAQLAESCGDEYIMGLFELGAVSLPAKSIKHNH